MGYAKQGDTVSVQYIGTLDDGRVFDSTTDETPRIFTLGANEVMPALEEEIMSMKSGEVRCITLSAEEAFGPRKDEHVLIAARSSFSPETDIHIGSRVQIEFAGGNKKVLLVTDLSESEVTLDGNHPLAGHNLTFALRFNGVLM